MSNKSGTEQWLETLSNPGIFLIALVFLAVFSYGAYAIVQSITTIPNTGGITKIDAEVYDLDMNIIDLIVWGEIEAGTNVTKAIIVESTGNQNSTLRVFRIDSAPVNFALYSTFTTNLTDNTPIIPAQKIKVELTLHIDKEVPVETGVELLFSFTIVVVAE